MFHRRLRPDLRDPLASVGDPQAGEVYNPVAELVMYLGEKVQLSDIEHTAESTQRQGAAEMPKARC